MKRAGLKSYTDEKGRVFVREMLPEEMAEKYQQAIGALKKKGGW